jgi:hypothetical protein
MDMNLLLHPQTDEGVKVVPFVQTIKFFKGSTTSHLSIQNWLHRHVVGTRQQLLAFQTSASNGNVNGAMFGAPLLLNGRTDTAANIAQGAISLLGSMTYEQHIPILLNKQTAGILQLSLRVQEFVRSGFAKRATPGL